MWIQLLIAAIAPVVTEMVKTVLKEHVVKIPKPLVPVLSGFLGALAALFVPEAGLDVAEGGVAGLAGTGVHQLWAMLAGKITRSGKAKHKAKKGGK